MRPREKQAAMAEFAAGGGGGLGGTRGLEGGLDGPHPPPMLGENAQRHRLSPLRPREKQAAMAEFAAGGADVLVATSVIEVGIDVPNATVMLVENAERYGISQLHQLRGRIGRGGHASVCVLFGPKESPRLRALAEHGDGFKLAEIDLELRGEGEMLGTRQSGLAQFRVARLPEDAELLERARMRARTLLDADPGLRRPEHILLEDAVHAAYGAEALEPIPA